MSSSSKRIVVTGIGAVTPVGIGKEAYWNALASGTSGVGNITLFDTTDFEVRIAGEVKNFDPSSFMERRDAKRADRFTQFAIAAAKQAVEDSGLVIDSTNAERVGVLIGSGIGGLATLEEQIRILIEKGPNRVSPFLIPMMIVNMASGMVSILTGAKGPNSTVATACATGAHAIGDCLEIIRRGDADAMIVGGAEAAVTPVSMAGFGNMKAMASKFNSCPEKASRPFDAGREGFVIGEGAGVLLIETLESAEKRGAKQIYAELVGYGMSGDAYHMSAPAPGGEGVARAIRACLKNAGLEAEQVDYVNAHATSTPIGDPSEIGALRSVFGDRFKTIPVSATKSMTGHLLGGAGGIEAIATALALYHELLPPTINYETPDPECEVDCVPNVARKAKVDVALSNNFGFGGHNAVVAFKRFA